MGNEKKSIVAMIIVTIIAIIVCIATVVIVQSKPEPQVIKQPVLTEQKKELPKKTVKKRPIVATTAPKSEEEKKRDEAEEMKEVGAELASFLQNSKLKEMMLRRMTAKNKAYLKDLFEKYGIDEKTQKEISSLIAETQLTFIETMMASGGMTGDGGDEMREKLADINQKSEEQIADLSSTAFLADAKDKRTTEKRENYLNRIDRSLKGDKMSSEQRKAMDDVYRENQITDAERFTLPSDEIKRRQKNIDDRAREILSDGQYQKQKRSSRNPLGGMGMGGGRGKF